MSFSLGNLRSALQSGRLHVCIVLVFGLLAITGQALAGAMSISETLRTQIVDGIQIITSLFAVLCCLGAAGKRGGVSRTFWILFGGALALQFCGDVGWGYAHFFGVTVSAPAMFPSLFYRLYAGPMAIALFLSEEVRGTRFQSFLDGCIVVGLAGLTMYQVQMAEMGAHDARIWQTISLSTAVNTLLLVAAFLRYFVCTPNCLRGLFLRQVIYVSIYLAVCIITSVADAYAPRLSSYADLLWCGTYLAAAALAATWRPSATEDMVGLPRISRRTSLLCFNLTLATMVLTSAILGLRLVNSTRVVGLVGVAVVLFSFAIRSALMQDAQERTLGQLQDSRAELRRQALYDALTGLPNRRLLVDRLSQALAGAKRDGSRVALLYLDLDGFKPVNDMFGHAAGDRVLVEVARRLRSRTRESDTVARMGGDEFTLLMNLGADGDHAKTVARALLKSLNEPMEVEQSTVTITASVGIGLFPDDATDCDSLLGHADCAMYAAKRQGTNNIQFYAAGFEATTGAR